MIKSLPWCNSLLAASSWTGGTLFGAEQIVGPRIYLEMGEQVRTLDSEIHPAAKLQLTTQATKDWIHASRINLVGNSDLPESSLIIADGFPGVIQNLTCD